MTRFSSRANVRPAPQFIFTRTGWAGVAPAIGATAESIALGFLNPMSDLGKALRE